MNKETVRLVLIFCVALLCLALISGFIGSYGRSAEAAQSFTLPSLTSIDGQPIVAPSTEYAVVFFATWCEDCRRSYKHIAEFKQHHPDLPIYGLSLEDDVGALKSWIKSHGDPFRQLAIITRGQAYNMGMAKVPYALLIEDGKVKRRARELNGLIN